MSATRNNDSNHHDYDYLFKLRIEGGRRSGKSSLILRLADDVFTEAYISTIGVDFKTKTIQNQRKNIKMQLWDEDKRPQRTIVDMADRRGLHGYLIAIDLTNHESFADAQRILADLGRHGSDRPPVIYLVGTKSDLQNDRVVSSEQLQTLADSYSDTGVCGYIETSAKNNENLNALLQNMAENLRAQNDPDYRPVTSAVKKTSSNPFKALVGIFTGWIARLFQSPKKPANTTTPPIAQQNTAPAIQTPTRALPKNNNRPVASTSTVPVVSLATAQKHNTVSRQKEKEIPKVITPPPAQTFDEDLQRLAQEEDIKSLTQSLAKRFEFLNKLFSEELVDPITQDAITIESAPVTTPSGQIYAQESIVTWLRRNPGNPTDPMTREILSEKDLVPNQALSDLLATVTQAQDEFNDALKLPTTKIFEFSGKLSALQKIQATLDTAFNKPVVDDPLHPRRNRMMKDIIDAVHSQQNEQQCALNLKSAGQ